MIKPSKTGVIAYTLFLLSFCMVLGAIYSVATVDVLKDWKLNLPSGEIRAGQTIIISSTYTKLRDVTGTATRYVDCDANNGSRLSYILNQKEANRAAGSKGTAVEITLPTNISFLPTTCDIRIVVKYRVVPFKDTTEINQTKDFVLLPSLGTGSSAVVELPTQTNQSQTPASSLTQQQDTLYPSSSSNASIKPQAAQSNSVQPATAQPQSTTTTNTTNTTTNTSQAQTEQNCTISLLGLNLLCN